MKELHEEQPTAQPWWTEPERIRKEDIEMQWIPVSMKEDSEQHVVLKGMRALLDGELVKY